MLDPDPLYVELPTCAPRPRRYTVSNRGPHARRRPMIDWLHGLLIGLAFGIPVAVALAVKRGAPTDAALTRRP